MMVVKGNVVVVRKEGGSGGDSEVMLDITL